jgi:hypothetical protein
MRFVLDIGCPDILADSLGGVRNHADQGDCDPLRNLPGSSGDVPAGVSGLLRDTGEEVL